ncbi:fatty acid hydroxylase [Apodospora peruviana]|uniref:Fatty acid hydroxylase n=1 Tax=Apodospora peruviana TaxID=516989 RepID=A0AAE0HSR7_9PEZI|nr:fatty acid hydroxylase [Apodospora peruviana]
MDSLLARYPPGYIEVLGSITVQLLYLVFGLLIEPFRPAEYHTKRATSSKMILLSLRNHIFVTLLHAAYVFINSGHSVLTKTFDSPYTPPTLTSVIRDLAIALIFRDVIFWTIHRLWHLPFIYEHVHAKHHEVTHPADHHVWTISYMSVTDFVFLYGLPVVAVAKTLEMDILTTLVFAFISAAGEQVKLVWGDEAHDEHHLDLGVNYGVYGFMDWVCGTTGCKTQGGKGKGE